MESGEVEGGMRAGPEGLREGERAGPTTGLLCSGAGEGKMPHPSPPVAVGELPLPLSSSSAWESGPCALPGQHSGARPGGVVWVSQS